MKIKKTLPLVAFATLILSSCELSFSLPGGSTTSTTTSATSSVVTSIEPGHGYYLPSSYAISQAQYNAAAGLFTLGATGTKKLLVIPVIFSDYYCTGSCAGIEADLYDTFFGDAAATGWESVASYYEKSSYGALTLEGIVTPTYESIMTSGEFASNVRTTGEYADYYDPTWVLVEDAVDWYKDYSSSSLTEYDTDRDGFIDAVWLVYLNPNSQNKVYATEYEDVFWAYTYWDYDNWSNGNPQNPVPMTYGWASFDFMYEGYGSSSLDAHTYIHETGHVLGLDDYYSYTEDDWGPAGGVDMMDYNIVDHNAYSKFLLGWVNPYVVDGTLDEITITINPFESSGEFILINDGWNESPYDEYLALEFYTPTGLNYLDSQVGGYPGNGLRGFYEPGIKIYHVDSRLGAYNFDGDFIGYTDTTLLANSNYPYIAASNSSEFSQDENYRLLHLLEAGGVNTFKNDLAVATNATLFQQGDSFSPNAFASFFTRTGGRFNDGSNIGYSIEVTSMTSTSATVTITKI